ncbi:hypothetical protein BC938DRAFT_477598, partial [Jimgerdemannia flammicorona]
MSRYDKLTGSPISFILFTQIPLVVGNESGSPLTSISLADFLRDIPKYTGLPNSLFAPNRDSHALVSAQACFLPVPPPQQPVSFFGGGVTTTTPSTTAHTTFSTTDFHVQLYNYQSQPNNPAVLVIVATSKGTSAQLAEGRPLNLFGGHTNGQKLWFNNNGKKCSFSAQRLTENRKERGETDLTKPMTQEEKQNNAIVVIQVPLKQSFTTGLFGTGTSSSFSFGTTAATPAFNTYSSPAFDQPSTTRSSFGCGGFGLTAAKVDVENAIVKLGTDEGPFPTLHGRQSIERDDRYPVRVTLQWYKVTSNGLVDDAVLREIAGQMADARSKGDFWGSLVVDKQNWFSRFQQRPTEKNIFSVNPPMLRTPSQPSTTPSLFQFPTPKVYGTHPNTVCDNCRAQLPAHTPRYRCVYCPDFDLCSSCELDNKHGHNPAHLFLKINDSTAAHIVSNILLQSKERLVHEGVSCYFCFKAIVGARYVCTQCSTVWGQRISMCEECEQNGGHAGYRHPLVKVWFDEDLKNVG